MTDYSKLKGDIGALFDKSHFPEPQPTTDSDHMASRHPHELANRAAVTTAQSPPKNEVVNVGGLTVVPGQGAAPQFMGEQPIGLTIEENLAKEAHEEAGIGAALARTAKQVQPRRGQKPKPIPVKLSP